eukprot:c47968_g1_i1.p1 GENE.c47968_g1_i1~~c47968_g1_i1.p1  ORF type:complete len:282 (-),score=52.95 c47968_g1_i1:230-1075(-)
MASEGAGVGQQPPPPGFNEPSFAAASAATMSAIASRSGSAESMAPRPRPSCPEQIVFCIDVCSEMDGMELMGKGSEVEGQRLLTRLDCVKAVVSNFVAVKLSMRPDHEFALVVLSDRATWKLDFTSDATTFNFALHSLAAAGRHESFDFGTLFAELDDHVSVPPPSGRPPYTVRAIVLFARSGVASAVPAPASPWSLLREPLFFLDVEYLHEKPSRDNDPQAVYNSLTYLESASRTSLFYEDSTSYRRFVEHMTLLLGHPLQRAAPSTIAGYKVGGKAGGK